MSKGKSAHLHEKPKCHLGSAVFDFVFAWHTTYDDDAPADGMSQVLWVLGFIITIGRTHSRIAKQRSSANCRKQWIQNSTGKRDAECPRT